MKKRVIYTAIVGVTDSLMQPSVLDPRYDYVCFVAKGGMKETRQGAWQLREIPFTGGDARMQSRYPKMHPDELFPDYEWTLWMDGNLSIETPEFYSIIDYRISAGAQMSAPLHPLRDCIYDEAYAVVASGKGDYASSRRVIRFLRSKGYPRHAGLFENSILLRPVGNPAVIAMDSLWWECLQTLAGRDQLSLMYCARECGVKIDPLLPEGEKLRDCSFLHYVNHDAQPPLPWLADKWRGARKCIAKWLLRRQLARI